MDWLVGFQGFVCSFSQFRIDLATVAARSSMDCWIVTDWSVGFQGFICSFRIDLATVAARSSLMNLQRSRVSSGFAWNIPLDSYDDNDAFSQ